jgi:hypothetical protein
MDKIDVSLALLDSELGRLPEDDEVDGDHSDEDVEWWDAAERKEQEFYENSSQY